MAVAIGASAIFKGDALKKFGRQAREMMASLAADRRGMDPAEMHAEKQRQSDRVVAEFQKLAAFVTTGGRIRPG